MLEKQREYLSENVTPYAKRNAKRFFGNFLTAFKTILIVLFFSYFAFLAYLTKIDKSLIVKFGLDQNDLIFGAVLLIVGQSLMRLLTSFVRDSSYRFMDAVVVPKGSKADIRLMEKYMKQAEYVTIYSGDFSFVGEEIPLLEILSSHANRGNLTLISYKSRLEVLKSMNQFGTQLVGLLESSGRIFFSSPARAKYSLIKAMGSEVLLYRYQNDGDDPHIGIFKGSDARSRQLLDTIEVLTNGVVSVRAKR